MKLIVATGAGFVAAIVTAVLIGFFIGMAFPLPSGSPAFYAAEFAGVVISMTVWYFLARLFYRRLKSRESTYAERLA